MALCFFGWEGVVLRDTPSCHISSGLAVCWGQCLGGPVTPGWHCHVAVEWQREDAILSRMLVPENPHGAGWSAGWFWWSLIVAWLWLYLTIKAPLLPLSELVMSLPRPPASGLLLAPCLHFCSLSSPLPFQPQGLAASGGRGWTQHGPDLWLSRLSLTPRTVCS